MASKQWKNVERELAEKLGGCRTGPTGKNDCDVSGIPDWGPEVKYMQRLCLRTDHIKQAKANAARVGKRWLLYIREAKSGRRVVVLDLEDFVWLFKKAYDKENV
jgi:hypothetical protein